MAAKILLFSLSYLLVSIGPLYAGGVKFQLIPAQVEIGDPYRANGVSTDGSVVVGTMTSPEGIQGFRWSMAGGLEGLGDLMGGNYLSEANAISGDGSVVVGYSISGKGNEAFRWTESEDMVGLGDFITGGLDAFDSKAFGVSADGSVVVGYGSPGPSPAAFHWTNGIMSRIGLIGAGNSYLSPEFSRAVSADGQVAVGSGHNSSPSNYQAYRWTTSNDSAKLGDLSGGSVTSAALGVSSDGSVVVGYGTSGSAREPFRWTEQDGMIPLGNLPGGGENNGEARAVSADGSIVVGNSFTHMNPGYTEAFIWTPKTGILNLRSYLIDHGVSGLSDWILTSANAITPDGRVIVGSALSSDLSDSAAWIVTLPEPSSLCLTCCAFLLPLLWRRKCKFGGNAR